VSEKPGALASNVLHFARALRAAGLPLGSGAILDALAAVEIAGLRNRENFRATLEAVFVKKREHAAVFDQAFNMFWRRRGYHEQLIASLSPAENAVPQTLEKPAPAAARAAQALSAKRPHEQVERVIEQDQRLTMSDVEALRAKDFAQMSAEEIAAANRAIAMLNLRHDSRPTRRLAPDARGARIDPRCMFRNALRQGNMMELARRSPQKRKIPIVAICDISGSMSDYTRVFLHFLHALSAKRGRVHTFLFGTRLTNVTRALRHKDPDEALALCAQEAQDWSGGTRIGASLHRFNADWSRRVLGQGAIVLLFTDGLEREGVEDLARATQRLHKSCRRLIWLNPLLRFDRFEPRQQGVRAMLPNVDEFRPVHNLASVAALVQSLSENARARADVDPRVWLKRAG
jgi:uncharacterized protein with von Willebrand factor type A (vWA) domain